MSVRLRSILAMLLLALCWTVRAQSGLQGGASPGDDFLKLIDAKQYAQSWDVASDLFRKSVSKDDWVAQARQAREPLGAVVARRQKSSEVQKDPNGAPKGEYLLVTYETTFSASAAPRTETLPLVKGSDGRWQAVGYFVR